MWSVKKEIKEHDEVKTFPSFDVFVTVFFCEVHKVTGITVTQ